jgi:hypothetical protein
MHVLIIGRTLSGKSTLGKRLSHYYKSQGFGILVLDPTCDPDWQADFQTSDPERFLQVYWKSRNCMAFVDESGDAIGRYNKVMNATATRGRHNGHLNHYLMHRHTQVDNIIRDQCTRLFLFSASAKDGDALSEEFGHEELRTCNLLKTGEHFQAVKMGTCRRVNLFSQRSEDDEASTLLDDSGSNPARRGDTHVSEDDRSGDGGSGGGGSDDGGSGGGS